MEIIRSNEYILVAFEPSQSMLFAKWQPSSAEISHEYFREINYVYVELVEKYKLNTFLLDTTEFGYTIEPDMQMWVAENILPKISDLGMKKIAFLVSHDFISQLSIEQTMEEKVFNFLVRYFHDQSEAQKWLEN